MVPGEASQTGALPPAVVPVVEPRKPDDLKAALACPKCGRPNPDTRVLCEECLTLLRPSQTWSTSTMPAGESSF